jgi:hypothetical protein
MEQNPDGTAVNPEAFKVPSTHPPHLPLPLARCLRHSPPRASSRRLPGHTPTQHHLFSLSSGTLSHGPPPRLSWQAALRNNPQMLASIAASVPALAQAVHADDTAGLQDILRRMAQGQRAGATLPLTGLGHRGRRGAVGVIIG